MTPFDGAAGATLTFVTTEPIQTLEIVQPGGDFSPITAVQLSNGSTTVEASVTTPDELGRSTIAVPTELAAGPTSLTITAVDERTTIDRRYGDVLTLPAAVAELSSPAISRSETDGGTTIAVECAEGLLSIDGEPIGLSFSTTAAALLAGEPISAEVCSGPVALAAGDHRVIGSNSTVADPLSAMTVDRVVLRDVPDAVIESPPPAPIAVVVERDDPRARTVSVAACPDGCWLVLGEGYNQAWHASVDGDDLGTPQLIDGGFNGWWLTPSEQPVTVELRWTAQTPVSLGLAIGLVTSLLLVLVIALSRSLRVAALAPPVLRRSETGTTRGGPVAAVLIVAAALLIAPVWGIIAVVPAALTVWSSRRPRRFPWSRPLEVIGLATACAVAVSALWIERSRRPFPDAGWTLQFDHLNGLAVFSLLVLTVGAMFADDAEPVTAP